MLAKLTEHLIAGLPLTKQLDVAIPTMDAALPTAVEKSGGLLWIPVCLGVILVLALVFILARVYRKHRRTGDAASPASAREDPAEERRED